MKKLRRFLAMLLTLLLCVGEFAATGLTVHAATMYNLWVGGVRVTSENEGYIDCVTGTGAKASYDPTTQTLTFENVTGFEGTYNNAYIYAEEDLTIDGDVSVTGDISAYGIYSTKNVTIKGDLAFEESGDDTESECRVKVDGTLCVDGGNLYADNYKGDSNSAVLECSDLQVKSGTVTAQVGYADETAIRVENELKLEGGRVRAYVHMTDDTRYAVVKTGKLNMTGGILDVSTWWDGSEDDTYYALTAASIILGDSIRITDPAGGDIGGMTFVTSGGYPAVKIRLSDVEEYNLWVGGTRITSGNKDNIPSVTGTDAKASYDPDTKTLTFENVTGFADAYENAYIYTEDDLTIKGDISVTWTGKVQGIIAKKDITIKGTVTFNEIEEKSTSSSGAKIQADKKLCVDGGNIYVSSNDYETIRCSDLHISAGKVTAIVNKDDRALHVNNEMKIEGGEVTVSSRDGFATAWVRTLTMTGGSLEVTKTVESDYALYAGSIDLGEMVYIATPAEGKIISAFSTMKTIADAENNCAYHILLSSEGYNLWVGNTRVTTINKSFIPCDAGTASYDPETNTLTFDNATITTGYEYEEGNVAGIYAVDIPITIKGKVSVDVAGADYGIYAVSTAARENGSIILEGDITLKSCTRGIGAKKYGIKFRGGTIDIDSTTSAVMCNGRAVLQGGEEILSPEGAVFSTKTISRTAEKITQLYESDSSDTLVKKATIGATVVKYTVTFDLNGKSGTAPEDQMVEAGGTVEEPTAPTATGWVFGGWYTDADGTTAYDFTAAVTGDLELYAKWTKEKIDVSGVMLDKVSAVLEVGENVILAATVVPVKATDKTVTWSSNRESVATVDPDGKVTAVAAGTAIIIATATNGTDETTDDQTAIFSVTVKEEEAPKVDISKVTLDQTTVSLAEEETVTLTATVAPTDATDKTVTWSSDKESVATVDADGKVTAVKAGTATITVTATNGTDDTADDKTATCTVTVTEAEAPKTDITGITLNKTSVTVEEGKTESLTATVTPEDATDKTVTWTSSDEAVATVDADGKVTAVAAGTATITVTATNGTEDTADDKTATCEVTVTAATEPKTDITGVTLDKAELTVEEGKTETLAATVAPEDASSKDVIWSSSDDTVATIDADGVVVAVKAGTATITVTATNGTEDTADDQTATCEVTVTEAETKTDITGITLDKTTVSLEVEQIETLTVTVEPEEATDKNVTFKSSDEKIATVDEEGKITAVAEGSTVIIVTADNGTAEAEDDKTATCIVTVTAKKTSSEIPEEGPALVKDIFGKTIYYKDGEAQKDYNGLVNVDGTWYYVEKGVLSETETGFVMYEDGLFLVVEGKLLTSKSGLVQDPYNPDIWYFLADGQVQTQYTGLALYDGEWFYVNKGRLDTTIAAYIEYDGGLFYVAAGRILKEVSGLAQDPNGPDWYFLAEGQAQTQYTGLALYDGEWFYVVEGKLAEDYTGTVEYDGSEFNVVNGMVK